MNDNEIAKTLSLIFARTCAPYNASHEVISDSWKEIEDAYRSKNRYYHTLRHLHYMYGVLQEVSSEIKDMPLMLFALFYHDFIYNPLRGDNEEKSATVAINRLGAIGLDSTSLQIIGDAIRMTKGHENHRNSDINFFLDADLAVLGFGAEEYKHYASGIRREYSLVPDLVYKPGRKKILRHFLEMDFIYKTVPFRLKFEDQARQNIEDELKNLG